MAGLAVECTWRSEDKCVLISVFGSQGWTQKAPLLAEPYCQPMTLILNCSLLSWSLYLHIHKLATKLGNLGYIMSTSNSIFFPISQICFSFLFSTLVNGNSIHHSGVIPWFFLSLAARAICLLHLFYFWNLIIIYLLPSPLYLPTLSLDSFNSFFSLLVLMYKSYIAVKIICFFYLFWQDLHT